MERPHLNSLPHPAGARRGLCVLLVFTTAALAALAIAAAHALAAPELSLEMSQANAYGLQGGVDPYTGSGTTFARESWFNTYTITVKNTALPPSAEPSVQVGQTLPCEPGTWYEGESFSYRWLRDGAPIAGAESDEYQVTAADAGHAVQCVVTDANAGAATGAASNAVPVAPTSSALPKFITLPEMSPQGATFPVGEEFTCAPGEWSGNPTFSYKWLRNGTAIPGAESSDYVATAADEGATLQCQVTATNAGGSTVADNLYFAIIEPEPAIYPPLSEYEPGPTIPVSGETNATAGAVTVTDRLPSGLVLAGQRSNEEVYGEGWDGHPGEGKCTIATGAGAVTCTRENSLGPGEAYPPITLHVRVTGEAPLGTPPSGGITNAVSVEGGGASAVAVNIPTTIAPAVPFGIRSFDTSVLDALGEPFTQAGGHPFSASTELVFNYTPGTEGHLVTAGGGDGPKEIQVELPPGFIGDPQSAPRCPLEQLSGGRCPLDTAVGYTQVTLAGGAIVGGQAQLFAGGLTSLIYNLEPAPGHPAEFGFVAAKGVPFVLEASVRSDGDYGITVGDSAVGSGVLAVKLTFCSGGAGGTEPDFFCNPVGATSTPFLTTPAQCTGPAPVTTVRADSWNEPADYVSKTVYNGTNLSKGAPSASESFVTGCNLLRFAPEAQLQPSSAAEGGTTQADEPTGATFALKVPQTNEVGVNATPELRDASVALPEGMTVDPSAADGLQACSDAQFGLGSSAEPAEPAACPPGSQIGTVKVVTPLLEKPLEGQVFVGEPECSPCGATDAEEGHLFRLFLQVRSVERGVIVKLAGHVSANPTTGRLQATFTQQPQLPFSELLLTFTGGARAPLANPQTCGTFTTTADLTPWSAPGVGGLSGGEAIAGTPDATPSSSFDIDWNGAGDACPASLPFAPSLSAGSQTPVAGASSPFTVAIGREDREQDVSAVTITTPPGLLGDVAQVPRCPEAQANAGTCGPESQIGTTTVGAGPGPHPFYLGGRVYLTGPYAGRPFGLSIVVPAIAGPFNLGNVIVRASIAVNPATGALTIASNPLPQYVAGVQLRLRKIEVEIDRPGFMLNPTSCAPQTVSATIAAAQGASAAVSAPFDVGGCQSLPFAPSLTASTQGRASKAGGASLNVTVRSAPGQANIAKVDLELPGQLPARLTTLQQACTEAQFDANPAGCPAGSDIGTARAITPILSAPLTGPAYLVSHGGAAFPDVEFVLQGEGVEIVLDGHTDIKGHYTYSRFETVPDAPISVFETSLPEGPHSILGTALPASAKYSLCGQSLSMPTILTAQNGKQIRQNTRVAVTGCAMSKPLTRAQKLAKALKACRKDRKKHMRSACERRARKRYAARAGARRSKDRPANAKGKRSGRSGSGLPNGEGRKVS